jgi:hypothetical protein
VLVNLSTHFTLEEFIASEVAARRGIDNTMPTELMPASVAVCTQIAEPARSVLGPLRITSGYRCPALNKAIGGAKDSQHMRAEALDLIPVAHGVRVLDLLLWIHGHVIFDQLIWEFGGAWCHASYSLTGPQRRETLAAVLGPPDATGKRKTVYARLTDEQIKALEV